LPTASKFKIFDNNYYLNQLPYENEYRYYGGLGGSGRIGGAAIVARKPVIYLKSNLARDRIL